MYNGIPHGAVAAAVVVFVYSVLCLASSVLLACMCMIHGERASYISVISVVIAISCVASIIQQGHYATHFRSVQETQLEQAKLSLTMPVIGYGPLSTGLTLVLFEIQFYCYNVEAILVFFWSIALAKGVYNYNRPWLAERQRLISGASKVFAIVLPGVLLGVSASPHVRNNLTAALVVTNIELLGSLLLGSICVICILVRYIHCRHQFASISNPSQSISNSTDEGPNSSRGSTRKIRVDKILLLRFGIAFVILSLFEIAIILFEISRSHSAQQLAMRDTPNYSVATAISTICAPIPGVTAGLLAFLLFGTTAHFRLIYARFFNNLFKRFRPRRRSSGGSGRNTILPSRPDRHWTELDTELGPVEQYISEREIGHAHRPSFARGGTYHCSIQGGCKDDENTELALSKSGGVTSTSTVSVHAAADEPEVDRSDKGGVVFGINQTRSLSMDVVRTERAGSKSVTKWYG